MYAIQPAQIAERPARDGFSRRSHLMVASLTHPSTWLMSGTAQVVFQLSIAAPVFWTARNWMTGERLERVLLLVFCANFPRRGSRPLQVYYPQTFMPPEFSRLALRMNADIVGALTYIGADGREIVRPPGLSDIPGGAAVSATDHRASRIRVCDPRAGGPQTAAVVSGCVGRRHHGRLPDPGPVHARHDLRLHAGGRRCPPPLRPCRAHRVDRGSAAALVVASFTWAVAVGGDSVVDRFQSLLETGVVQSYQENRGIFLTYTLQELLYEYPFGAGIGRWGMMSAYFGEPANWQFPSLWAEIQLTGWLYDGGILLWICYAAAVISATAHTYRIASESDDDLSDLATMVLTVQVLVIGSLLHWPRFQHADGHCLLAAQRGRISAPNARLSRPTAGPRRRDRGRRLLLTEDSVSPSSRPRVLHIVPALFGRVGHRRRR